MIGPDNLKFAVIGCGEHSHVHADTLQKYQGVSLTACCDIESGKAKSWAQK